MKEIIQFYDNQEPNLMLFFNVDWFPYINTLKIQYSCWKSEHKLTLSYDPTLHRKSMGFLQWVSCKQEKLHIKSDLLFLFFLHFNI